MPSSSPAAIDDAVWQRVLARTPGLAGYPALYAPFLSAPRAADGWLAALSPPASAEEMGAMHAAMAFARKEGFLLMVRGGDPARAYQPEVLGDGSGGQPVALMAGLEDGAAHRVASLLAPVFAAPGKVAFVIGLMGFDRAMSAGEIRAIAARLREACGRVSGYLGS